MHTVSVRRGHVGGHLPSHLHLAVATDKGDFIHALGHGTKPASTVMHLIGRQSKQRYKLLVIAIVLQ